MKRFATGLTVLLFVLGATQARAVTSAIRYATITGTANSPTGSECTGEGYAGQCPSGSCTCVEIASAVVGKVSGQFGIDGTGTAVCTRRSTMVRRLPAAVAIARHFLESRV